MKYFDDLLNDLKFVDDIIGHMLPENLLEFYLAGGSACILAGYIERATKDFDIIDLGYSSTIGKILNYLQPYDLLDVNHAEIAYNFKDRAKILDGFNNIKVYVLSREDIIASKIGRYEEKDRNDINVLMNSADLSLVTKCIKDTFSSITNPRRKQRYLMHLDHFNSAYKLNIEVNTDV
ncbi:MAG: DUF6036 family nucleotidyltransferase [Bacillota bacterium]|nr:DUF6036 family nucleotidyltransferase [Bacillota bacterium]